MIAITCRRCGSTQLRKNGRTTSGQQKFHCKGCNFYCTVDTKDQERASRRETVEKLQRERLSQRAIARTLRMSRTTVVTILKKSPDTDWRNHSTIGRASDPGTRRMCSFVTRKSNVVWVWIALERQTRRIVGLAFGDRTTETCQRLWQSLPPDYRKRAICYSDFWVPYAKVLPAKRHRAVGKESGETAHIERFNNTLRQRCANLIRKTLSFSQDEHWHEVRIRLFIDHYNRQLERYGLLASV